MAGSRSRETSVRCQVLQPKSHDFGHGRLIGPVAWSVEAYKPEAQDVTSKVKSGGGDAP